MEGEECTEREREREREGGETDKGELMGLIWASSYFIGLIKSSEGALADDPIKVVDGIQLQCKLAINGKTWKPLGQDVAAGPGPMGGGYGAGSGPYSLCLHGPCVLMYSSLESVLWEGEDALFVVIT
ncbi:hypothetical protein IGI04_029380 [Brassica rapa subsp. trilocularis]|uniref:Uncharacterized protein n=1 Tax=Brassica rapa subsp. trilocularis TaxID=1813537 RepID=A0ABQ7LQX5_BRACM|nr:hypothetical protein IGI04_029380 [Brassica rapa subsp. trilocularis]